MREKYYTSLLIGIMQITNKINLKKLRRYIDYSIDPHLNEAADYGNIKTPFVQ